MLISGLDTLKVGGDHWEIVTRALVRVGQCPVVLVGICYIPFTLEASFFVPPVTSRYLPLF